jgi:hypothetical protein
MNMVIHKIHTRVNVSDWIRLFLIILLLEYNP